MSSARNTLPLHLFSERRKMDKDIYILGIESSCDDTSAAVLKNGLLLSNVTASQAVHESYGGVVPELASRAHQQNVVPVVSEAIKRAGISKEQLSAVAFTRGPGLMGSLLVGVNFAKGFARSLGIPLIDVNHLQGHVMAHFIKSVTSDVSSGGEASEQTPPFPFLCLLVSGGNSQIVLVRAYNDMEVLGQTIDDAAGEAIDKCSKVMGLGYPGGPIIDRLARQGNPKAYQFAEPHIPGLDYSFSGLKTSFLYNMRKWVEDDPDFVEHHKEDLAASLGVDHCGHPDEETETGCEADGYQTCGCGWWRECQQRTAQCFPRSCTPLWLDYLYSEVQLYDRQCRHDWHRGLL